jgi:hypothetical protein
MSHRFSIPRVVLVAAAALLMPPAAEAEIKRLTVLSAEEIGPFRGKPYHEIQAQMEGTAPGGAYAVPVTLAFPVDPADHNGFAVVDVVNTVTIGWDDWVLNGGAFPLARVHMGDDLVLGSGNVYVGVIWDKNAVEALGNGSIAEPADGYTILHDAAALARNPAEHLPADVAAAPASERVVAYGYSQTGSLLRTWFFERMNTGENSPSFDGALVAGAAGVCLDLPTSEWVPCEGPLADGAKVIVLAPETDVEWGSYLERGEHPDYRVIEIPGVSHIPSSAADFRDHGMPDQNPVDFGPIFRAALVNLQAWLDGVEPPPSIMLELSDAAPREFDGAAIRFVARDDDGNALGGVRLPHLRTVLDDGREVGAPLGQYTGFAWDYEDSNFFFTISGTFTPFSPERIAALYPDRATYLEAVKAAAEDLAAKRYILEEDAQAYVEAAQQADLGR